MAAARSSRPAPLVLCIVDGLGSSPETSAGNAPQLADMPHLTALLAEHPSVLLEAAGEHVGLAPGAPGNGEAGHRTIGAGRVVPGLARRIDEAIAERRLARQPALDRLLRTCSYDECALHLIGLISTVDAHASLHHLEAVVDEAAFQRVPVVIHAVLDGRDANPRGAWASLEKLQIFLEGKGAVIGSVSGRWYAMASDGPHWERLHRAFHAIVRDPALGPDAPAADTAYDAIQLAYGQGLDDDRVEPTRVGGYAGLRGDLVCDFSAASPVWEWTGEECGLALNHRPDGLAPLVSMLTRQGVPDETARELLADRGKPVRAFRSERFATMSGYGIAEVPAVFSAEPLAGTLGEALAAAGRSQLRCAESAKAAHVTRFFSGGRAEPFAGESRAIIPSPRRCDRYDEEPAMSAARVAERASAAVAAREADFILVSFANADAVAATGSLEATIAALEAVDAGIGTIAAAVRDAGGALVVTSDHGRAEAMLDERGKPSGALTTSPVPFVCALSDRKVRLRSGGSLADVAPTVLHLLGIPRPAAMTGRALIEPSDG